MSNGKKPGPGDKKPVPKVPPPGPGGGSPGGVGSWIGPVIGAGLGLLSARSTNARAMREAEKNREFQREMSDTAHQREMRDAMAAGINPIFVAGGGGASTPSGAQADVKDPIDSSTRAVATALQLKQMRAQVALTEAQAERERESAAYTRVQIGDMTSMAAAGRYVEIANRVRQGDLTIQQMERLLPFVEERAKAEVAQMEGSGRAAAARAELDELARVGAGNIAEFERAFGPAGPAVKLFFELLRSVR